MRTTHLPRLSLCVVMGALAGSVLPAQPARGHETDQYFLPLDRPLADLGTYLDAAHTLALERVAADLNARIDRVRAQPPGPGRDRRLARLYDPRTVVDLVHDQFSDASTEVLELEYLIRSDWARRSYPGTYTCHWSLGWIYSTTHFPLDPRRITLLFQASTIKAHGVCLGTDKLSHFHHMGRMYHTAYLALRSHGMGEQEAARAVAHRYSDGGSPLGENAILGYFASGVFSNADLAANYTGFKFYLNLTEPVTLRGSVHEPLLVRKGPHWRLNQHVRPDSGWFGAFLSDHWNEALNPCLYSDAYIRGRARAVLKSRAEQVVEFYTNLDGRPAHAEYFRDLATSLRTLDGEDYGHRGSSDELLTLGNTCFPSLQDRSHERPTTQGVVVPIASRK